MTMSGIVQIAQILGPLRREQSRESVYEWFQWLVDRLSERERRKSVGAHARYATWKS